MHTGESIIQLPSSEMLRSHIIFDKNRVKDAHTIIRSKTNPYDSVELLITNEQMPRVLESKHMIPQVKYQEHLQDAFSLVVTKSACQP